MKARKGQKQRAEAAAADAPGSGAPPDPETGDASPRPRTTSPPRHPPRSRPSPLQASLRPSRGRQAAGAGTRASRPPRATREDRGPCPSAEPASAGWFEGPPACVTALTAESLASAGVCLRGPLGVSSRGPRVVTQRRNTRSSLCDGFSVGLRSSQRPRGGDCRLGKGALVGDEELLGAEE